MKSYVLRQTAGYVYITRNGNNYCLSLGETFSEDELATVTSTSAFTYLCTEDSSIIVVDAGTVVAPISVPVATVQDETAPPEAAPAAEVVPAPVEATGKSA